MFFSKVKKFYKIITNPLFFSAAIKGTFAGTEHENLLKHLDISYVIDVGSNRGQFALMSRKAYPNADIFSFEPLAEPRRIYQSIFTADNKVILFPFAIGNIEEKVDIHISQADDSSSLLPISATQTDLYPGTGERETREIQVYPLSHFFTADDIHQKSLLKIDVQGFELQVLEGCETLINKVSYCYVECSFVELYKGQAMAHQVISWLSKHQFKLEGVYNLAYDKKGLAVQGDFLFKHE